MSEINTLIHSGSKIHKDKNTQKILKYLCKGPKTSIPKNIKTEKSIQRLVKKGLMIVNDSEYLITDYGKQVLLANELGIRFLSLCALSEIYVVQSFFPNPKNGSYIIIRFSEKLEAVYSSGTTMMEFTRLAFAGYVCKKSKKSVYIPHSVYLKIKKHNLVLRGLQKWFIETCDKIDEFVDSDSNIISIAKKNII